MILMEDAKTVEVVTAVGIHQTDTIDKLSWISESEVKIQKENGFPFNENLRDKELNLSIKIVSIS